MPDITMCRGNYCDQRNTCYRFIATPSEYRQSYFVNPPNKGDVCDYYYKVIDDPKA